MAGLMLRGKIYYAIYMKNGKEIRKSLETDNRQLAKAKLRKIEDALDAGADSPLPSKTPLPVILEDYIEYLYVVKRDRNAVKIISYLRLLFGQISPSLTIKNSKISSKAVKQKSISLLPVIESQYLEQLTTSEIAQAIQARVRSQGIKGKTANRYREIVVRLINWAMSQRNVRMPQGKNPATDVERYKEHVGKIVYLNKKEIVDQLEMLSGNPPLQAIVAVYIFAGLRREEALWLTIADLDLDAGKHGVIHVRSKTVLGEEWVPKTIESRVVPISAALRVYIDRYTPEPSIGKWLFPSPEGNRWDPDNFSRTLRRVNKKSNLIWGCDEYRHTFGSLLAAEGLSLLKISKLMGNSEIICDKHYVSLQPETLCQEVDFLDPELVGGQKSEDPKPTNLAKEREEPTVARPSLRLVVDNSKKCPGELATDSCLADGVR